MTRVFSFVALLAVAMFAVAQAPTDRAGWVKEIEAALEAEKDAEAVALVRKAAKALPDEAGFRSVAEWFEAHGEKRIKDKGYEAGLAVAERALKVLPDNEKATMRVWRSKLYRFWSQELLDKKDVAGSFKVLSGAYKLYPEDPHVHIGVAYHAQEALAIAEGKSVDALIAEYQALLKEFPKVDDIPRRGHRQAAIAIQKLVDAEKFKDALQAVDRYAPLYSKPEHRVDMTSIAYDGWALHLAAKKQYEAALEKYVEGLKALPDHPRLRNNAAAIVDEWSAPARAEKKWDEAIRIYSVGLKYFPNERYLQDRKAYCEEMKKGDKEK